MKKFDDIPVYFIIVGIILNIAMFFYNKVSFTSLMIRSSIVIITFAATGYFCSYVLREAHSALASSAKQKKAKENSKKETGSTIDIRVNSEEDDELLQLIPKAKEDDFSEFNLDSFKKFMDQDSN